jgi:hypothetical protein
MFSGRWLVNHCALPSIGQTWVLLLAYYWCSHWNGRIEYIEMTESNLSGEGARYNAIFWFDQFFCPIGGAFWKRKSKSSSRRCRCSTWATLELLINEALTSYCPSQALGWDCYSVRFDIRFVLSIGGTLCKTQKLITPSIMNGISPNFYGMLVWWGYIVRFFDLKL